ncbi:MAG: PHP domain-containing protein [Marinilabiliaceae bacterium]|nr:PHP domain-containing protein [Marinilabiliaceae bacterium]
MFFLFDISFYSPIAHSQTYRADLHIHTVLSPCGSLEMTPVRIVQQALRRGLDLIAITDHNSMRQCQQVQKVGREAGLTVWCGVEINTREEVHCLAYFETPPQQDAFQQFLDVHLPNFPNDPRRFGDQVWVDANEIILGEESRWLIMALDAGIVEVAEAVKALNGIFIAAHADRPSYSIISQLGFVDPALPFDAIELSPHCNRDAFLQAHPHLLKYPLVSFSDAHCPGQIGAACLEFQAPEVSFDALRACLRQMGHPRRA